MKTLPSFTRPLRAWLALVGPAFLMAIETSVTSLRADVPAPVIQQFVPSAEGSVLLRWDATPDAAYQVLTTTNLGDAWSPVDYLIASSNSVTWQANGLGGAARFYKLATDAIAIASVEPSVIVMGEVMDIYIIGQGFGVDDVLQLIGPGGAVTLTNRVVVSSTLMRVTVGPTIVGVKPGDSLRLVVTSGSSGQTASSKAASLTVSATPGGSVHALYEPPQEPPASPQGAYLSKRGYDYYQAQSQLNSSGMKHNPCFQENKNQGEMPRDRARGLKEEIRENDTVVFDIQEGKKGLNAVNVSLARTGLGVKLPSPTATDIGNLGFVARHRPVAADPYPDPPNCCGYSLMRGILSAPHVNPFSGEVQLQEADLAIAGRGLDFIWARTYRSRPLQGYINLSPNRWTHSYDVSVAQTSDGIAVADGTGRCDVYYSDTNGVYSRLEFFNEGRLSNSVFTLTFPDTGRWVFNPFDASSAASGKLAQIIDRYGNTMSLTYDSAGLLAEIVDDLGRTNHIAYNTLGQLAGVTDFSGRTVSYQYYGGGDTSGSPGDLKSVTSPPVTGTPNGNDFPVGKTTTYTYSTGYTNDVENHLLLSVIDGKGQIVHRHVYQHNETNLEFLRCVSAQDGTNDPVYLTSVPQVASPTNFYATIKVTLRDAVGNVSECLYNSRNLPVALREYTGRAPTVGPVTDTLNRPINPVRGTDPVYYETRWSWNADSLCVQEIEPLGNSMSCVYESDYTPNVNARKKGDLRIWRSRVGNTIALDDTKEHVTRFDYDPRFGSARMRTRINELESRLQSFNLLARQYDPTKQYSAGDTMIYNESLYAGGKCYGACQPHPQTCDFVVSTTDPNGNGTTASYDAQGNRVKVRFPWLNSSTADEDFAYNSHGQLIAITNAPDANGYRSVDMFTYYTNGPQNGFVQTCTEDAGSLALTTSFEYDARGNVTRCVDPGTNDWLYTYNALDQLMQSSSPLLGGGGGLSWRISTQYSYDAVDNLAQVDRENRDENGLLDAANPQWTTRYTYHRIKRELAIDRERFNGLFVSTEYDYDANGNIALYRSGEAVNGNDTNKVVQCAYDERNLLFECVRAPGTTIASTNGWDYDANGNRHNFYVGPNYDKRFTYDGFNQCVSVADAMGNILTNRYDANGNVILSTLLGETNDVPGAAGNGVLAQTAYRYDPLNHLVETEAAIDLGALFKARQAANFVPSNFECTSLTDANGHVTSFGYDTASRLVSVVAPRGKGKIMAIRDALGNVRQSASGTEISDLSGSPQMFTRTKVYDALNRLVSTTDDVGNTETYAYDSMGNLRRQEDPDGRSIWWRYDGLGRPTATIADLDGDGVLDYGPDAVSLTTYDDNDCVLSTTDDNTNSTFYTYDAQDRCVLITHADGTHCSLVWSPRSNLISETDPNGTTVSYTYDLNDRCVRKDIAPNGAAEVASTTTFETFGYDGCSRLVLASNDVSRLTFAYNLLGDCTSNTQDGLTTTRTFDGVGNCLSMTYPSGQMVQYAYDVLDQVTNVSSGAGGLPPTSLAQYQYEGPGRVGRIIRPNGSSTRIKWNGLKNPPNAPDDHGWQQVAGVSHTSFGGAVVIDQRRFTYDPKQNKTTREQINEFAPGQGTLTNLWSYDPLNQLNRAINVKGTGSNFRGYHLDAEGNRLEVTNGPAVEVYTRDDAFPNPADFQVNQYTTTPFGNETHDANGNRVGLSSSAGQLIYAYDYADRLVFVYDASQGFAAPVVSFTYDALGNRISKTIYPAQPPLEPVTTYFVNSDCRSGEGCGNGIIETRTAGSSGGLINAYCYGGKFGAVAGAHRNEALARFSVSGQLEYFYLSDDLGNTLALIDPSGNTLERYEYDDFGAPQFLTSDGTPTSVTSSPHGNPFLFHGMEWDVEIGLYHQDAVYLDPPSGRSLSRSSGLFLPSGTPVRATMSLAGVAGNNPWSGGGGGDPILAIVPRSILKEYFQTGDKPTQPQFGALIDSMVNMVDDRYLLGLRTSTTGNGSSGIFLSKGTNGTRNGGTQSGEGNNQVIPPGGGGNFVLKKEEGGRHTPFHNKYRPQ